MAIGIVPRPQQLENVGMSQTGIGVIGAGYWGPNLVRNFNSSESADVRWVCDIDEDAAARLARRFGVERWTSSLDDVLADESVSGVAIATPAGTHGPIAERCFDAGKDVLVEKPLANDLDVGRRLVDRADAEGRVLMTDHTFCYTGTVQYLRQALRAGDIGDFQYYDSVRINLGLVQSDIDVIWDLAPHDLSILDFILPDGITPVSVAAQGSDPLGVGHPCVAYVSIQLSNGAIAHLHLNWLSPVKVRTILIGGSDRMMVWDDLKPTQRLSIYDSGATLETDSEAVRRRALVSYRIGDMVAPAISETEALALVAQEFVQSIENRSAPATDGHAGLRVLELLEAARRSLEMDGSPVTVAAL